MRHARVRFDDEVEKTEGLHETFDLAEEMGYELIQVVRSSGLVDLYFEGVVS